MCWAVYLASEEELPEIPWDADHPSFHVRKLSSKDDEDVIPHFTRPSIRYVGSHEGCGCGFFRDTEEPNSAMYREFRKALSALATYVRLALKGSDQLEMFLCWEGDQKKSPVSRVSLKASSFDQGKFPLQERQFAVIRPDAR